jgi:multidrug resistance efflux pump
VSGTNDHLRRLVENRRAWRLTLTAVIVIPILVVLPHARSLTVRNAVITAYLSHLKAPISGRIETIDVRPGSVSEGDVPLLSIRNPTVDGSRVARLEVQKLRAEREVDQLRTQLESLRALAATRTAEYGSNVSSVTQDLNSQLQTVTDRVSARSAALREAEGNLERVRSLYERNLLSLSDVEAAEALYENARAEHSANELERKRLTERLDEIRSGVFQVTFPKAY